MRITTPLPAVWSKETLFAHLATFAADGLTGWSAGAELHAEFPEREELTAEEHAAVLAHIAAYVYTPTWTAVRVERSVRFERLDDEVAKTLRQLRMAESAGDAANAAIAVAHLVELDTYGQALADVTNGPDPENPAWPTPPWEAIAE